MHDFGDDQAKRGFKKFVRPMPEIAQEFVRAYYTSLVYQRGKLRKYYDQDNATIWRDQLNSPNSIPFAQAEAFLIPDIDTGSTVTISDFNSLRLPNNGLAIVVHGTISFGNQTRVFGQYFILSEVSDRYFVMSDSLCFSGGPPGTGPAGETFLVPKRGKGKPKKKPGSEEPAPPEAGQPASAPKPATPNPAGNHGPAERPGAQRRGKPKDAGSPFVYIPASGQ
jgi:hypothetical protein